MNIAFRNDISSNYMVVEDVDGFSAKDYEVRVLTGNSIGTLLKFDYEVINGKTNVLYDISSREYLSKLFEYSKMNFDDVRKLVYSINDLLKDLQEYLLDPNNVILKKECIFVDQTDGNTGFCYFPYYGGNFILEMRELFSRLLSFIDYEDTKAVRLTYDIQKMVQTENFNYDEIIKLVRRISADDQTYDLERGNTVFVAEEHPISLSEMKIPEAEESGFFKKAGKYFRGTDPSDIYDDINELKIFSKIKKYGEKEQEETKDRDKNNKKKKQRKKVEKETVENNTETDFPGEILKLRDSMNI